MLLQPIRNLNTFNKYRIIDCELS